MIPLELWYSFDQTEGDVARTHEELDAALDRLAAVSDSRWAALATVSEVDNVPGPLPYAGFHADMDALMYPSRPERAYTRGEGTPDGEPLLYMQGHSDNEFPPNSEIPAVLIRQAVHEFADTGERPTGVE